MPSRIGMTLLSYLSTKKPARPKKQDLPTLGVSQLPLQTPGLSIARVFVLCFLERLPDVSKLDPEVLTKLIHPLIFALLNKAKPGSGSSPAQVMRGTAMYCTKIRAWQALVLLSRFVTNEIADNVCEACLKSFNETTHNQIRYFIELYFIILSNAHPATFAEAFLRDIAQPNLSNQHISSLMIIAGNLVLNAKCKLDCFDKEADKKLLKRLLASLLPWLGSTQGFTRAIAQLLCFELVPQVVPNIDDQSIAPSLAAEENDWFLKVTYNFLKDNREMTRLRSKKQAYFEQYDLNFSLENLLQIPVDDADEADPRHVVDAVKEALRATYEEAHGEDAPLWKQIEELTVTTLDGDDDSDNDSDDENENKTHTNSTAIVQRKIIPLDSLNLALEDLKEKRFTNAAGTTKQRLCVCASLVDKVPNLGGLARTSEIFAAESLVVPDKRVKIDSTFKSLSVGASDWINMEEVKEENLLSWLLYKKHQQGYWIVGLEQTSSSVPLHKIRMPSKETPIVLLLGKEKEGIPVDLLQAVDQCIEIPQFGMIRSLNVHVSGAICIWEFTKKWKSFD